MKLYLKLDSFGGVREGKITFESMSELWTLRIATYTRIEYCKEQLVKCNHPEDKKLWEQELAEAEQAYNSLDRANSIVWKGR